MLQHNETDWDFVWRLAKRIGFEFIVDDEAGRRSSKPERRRRAGRAHATPTTCTSFRPRITAVQQVEEVNVRGFDLKAKQRSTRPRPSPKQVTEAGIKRSEIVKASSPATRRSRSRPVVRSARARPTTMAQAQLDQLANAYLAAEGTCDGNPRIKAGVEAQDQGRRQQLLGHLPRRQGGPRDLTAAAATRRAFSNSAGEHTLLGQSGGGNGGGRSGRSTRSWSAS